jgi:putative pyruvate formate lyase activating enzyme
MAGSAKILKFLAEEISLDTYINIMAQYRPAYRAMEFAPFDRPVTRKEYSHVLDLANKYGLDRLDSRNK